MIPLALMHVLSATSEQQLSNAIQSNDFVFVKFYTPSCKHCAHLAPRFYDLSDMVSKAVLMQVDCSVHDGICNKYNVQGVPSLQLFKNGYFAALYDNLWRDPKPMLKWLNENGIY